MPLAFIPGDAGAALLAGAFGWLTANPMPSGFSPR